MKEVLFLSQSRIERREMDVRRENEKRNNIPDCNEVDTCQDTERNYAHNPRTDTWIAN